MKHRQLEAFRATMRAGSITGAAKLLHIAQPSVSRLIADLETAVGFRLFARSGRGLIATVEARRFHQAVESMLIGVDRLRETADLIRNTSDGVLTVGLIAVFAHSDLMRAVDDLHRARRDLQIAVSVRTNTSIIDGVLMQRIDIGVVSSLHPLDGLHVLHETSVPYVCLMPDNHALAKNRGRLDLNDVADEEFVTLPSSFINPPGVYSDVVERLRRHSRLTSHSVPAVASLARVTGALAIVDSFTAQVAQAMGGVVARTLTQDLRFPIAVVSRGQDTLSLPGHELAQGLIQRLEVAASEHGATANPTERSKKKAARRRA